MESYFKIPFYAKIALIFIGIFAFFYAIYLGQRILIPLVFATMLAISLDPMVNALASRKCPKILAIFIVVVLAILGLAIICYIVYLQLSMFSETYPKLLEKFYVVKGEFIHWLSQTFNVPEPKIVAWTKETQTESIRHFAIGESISEVGAVVIVTFLLPVYLFMILYYKSLLLEFLRKIFLAKDHVIMLEVLTNSKEIIQRYLVGLFLEALIVAVLNSVGLLLLGIEYAILLGIVGAILNIIPYLGGMISLTLYMLIAFVTKDSLAYPAFVIVLFLFIQIVDNNFIVPRIVAARVQLNALVSIIVVLLGEAFWGIPGMFLSIPLTAIAKVVFDNVEPLKPWGFLLGNIVPTAAKFPFKSKVRNT